MGHCASTVALNEQVIIRHICPQEAKEKRLEQLEIKGLQTLS